MFFNHHNETVFASTKGERQETIENLIASTLFRNGYYFLLLLSVLIVTPGIELNNTAIVIGGMIIAPLLSPIMLLSLSLVSRSAGGIIHALFVLSVSFVLVPLLSFALTYIFAPLTGHTASWIPGEINTTIYFFVAFCSGIAAAFALVKKEISTSIAGVAIVVSLLPPLCTVGIEIAYADLPHALAALTMFAVNLAGIVLAAALAFISLGFMHTTALQEKVLKKEQ